MNGMAKKKEAITQRRVILGEKAVEFVGCKQIWQIFFAVT